METMTAILCAMPGIGLSLAGAETMAEAEMDRVYRPQFHYTVIKGWINDPIGLVFYEGEYHIFNDHNPFSSGFPGGRTNGEQAHWSHAVSSDLVHWKHLPIALYPDNNGACWSGSGVVDWNNTAGFQIGWMRTGKYPGMPFNQQMSFPCELTLRTANNGVRLFRNPVREIETLHDETFILTGKTLKPGDNPLSDISGDLFDIEMDIEPGEASEFGIRLHDTPITYAGGKVSCLNCTAEAAPIGGVLKLRILVDRTSLEVFANDGAVSTSCILPKEKNTKLDLYARDGGINIRSLRVSKMKS